MRVLHVEHREARVALLDALAALMGAAEGLGDDELLAASRCRGWTVGDVLVHVHLGLQEMLVGLVTASAQAPDTDAAGYWRAGPAGDGDGLAHVRVVRLLASAYGRPTGLMGPLRQTAGGVASAVGALPGGVVAFQGHVLSTGDFLATWACELAVHHLDMGRELDLAPPAPAGLLVARRTVEALAGEALPDGWDDERAVLVGTGRVPLAPTEAEQLGPLAQRLPALG